LTTPYLRGSHKPLSFYVFIFVSQTAQKRSTQKVDLHLPDEFSRFILICHNIFINRNAVEKKLHMGCA